jgi:hypothetical protein
VQTLSGTVIEVQEVISKVHLLLRVSRPTIVVQLGSASWLARHNFTLAPGDQVTVTGSRINRLRRSFLIAREIQKGNQVLLLRDENGRPLWTLGRNLR